MKNLIQRFFCFIGVLHRWEISTVVNDGIVTDYHRCVRSTNCRYKDWMIVNREYPD
jgi:hypothetical protein